MNSVHDMGGMHGMGPIEKEENEPVFHEPWEARVFALRRAMGAWKRWNIDNTRYEVELVPAAEYLRLSYYARQFTAFLPMLIKSGFVTADEIATGVAADIRLKPTPALTAERAKLLVAQGISTRRDVQVSPAFGSGEAVRARNIHPSGHTRLPRYVRGRMGKIEQDRGVFVFPDTNAHFLGENPQHLYAVRFAARELWGEQASSRDAVYLDMWDDCA